MSGRHWEHFEHGADIGIRGFGDSQAAAFEAAALALTAVATDPESIGTDESVAFACAAPDSELLLVDWLNALIYQMATHRMLFGRFSVRLRGQRLDATAWGETVDVARHQPAVEIKGATYTELRVAQQGDGSWVAQCVVDV